MRPLLFGFLVLTSMLTLSCKQEVCHPLSGSWQSETGQQLVFSEPLQEGETGRAAALITYFGSSHRDTFFARANYQCAKNPGILDLLMDTLKNTNLQNHLFGLITWSGDSVFSLHYERGKNDTERPEVFDIEQAIRFRRK
jgi:hypothetical protein